MPSSKTELARRLELAKPRDSIRGMFFNVIFDLVAQHHGQDGVRRIRSGNLALQLSDLASYPVTNFLNLLYATADELEPTLGDERKVFYLCGGASVRRFASTGAGSLLFNVLGRGDARKLLAGAAKGYATTVNYGSREFLSLGERQGKMIFKSDMVPPPYHEGVLTEGLRAAGFEGTVLSRALALDHAEYLISWR